jgi:hypothetical protein
MFRFKDVGNIIVNNIFPLINIKFNDLNLVNESYPINVTDKFIIKHLSFKNLNLDQGFFLKILILLEYELKALSDDSFKI